MGYLSRIGVPYLAMLLVWSLIGIGVFGFENAAWISWLIVFPLFSLLVYLLLRRFMISAVGYLGR